MATDRSIKWYYGLLFAPLALQTAFTSLYLERRGLSHGDIGLVMAVGSLVGVPATLLWGHLGDRVGRKRLLTALLGLGSALCFPAMWLGHSLWPLLAIWVAFSFFRSPMIPLCDAYCLDVLNHRGDRDGTTYSRLRMWGSIGFIIASFGAPLLLPDEATSDPLARLAPVFAAYGVISLLFAGLAQRLPDPPPVVGAPRPRKRDLVRVALLPGVGLVLAIMFVSTLAHAGYYQYLSLYLESIGVADRWVGSYWGLAVIAEVLLLAVGTPLLERLGVRRLLLLGIAGRAVRQLAYAWPLHPLVVLAIQPLHALAFGATHVATIAFLTRTIPTHLRATGQAVLYAASYGLGSMIGAAAAGWLSDAATAGQLTAITSRTGLFAMFWLTGWLQVATLALALIGLRDPPSAGADAGDGTGDVSES